ncbi:hypothetical protein QEN19_003956 [Hanseniaspora menglaensis]
MNRIFKKQSYKQVLFCSNVSICSTKPVAKSINLRYLHTENREKEENEENLVINPYGIQYLKPELRDKVFGPRVIKSTSFNESKQHISNEFKSKILNKLANNSLENFNLLGKKTSRLKPVDIKGLPSLEGSNLEEHFIKIGKFLSEPYSKIIEDFKNQEKNKKDIIFPKSWLIKKGWHMYDLYGQMDPVAVEYPKEDFLVFDVETIPKISPYPVLAVCRSANHLYCWISPALEQAYHHYNTNKSQEEQQLKEWKQSQINDYLNFENGESDVMKMIKKSIDKVNEELADHVKLTTKHKDLLQLADIKLANTEKQISKLTLNAVKEEVVLEKEIYFQSLVLEDVSRAEKLKMYKDYKNQIKKMNKDTKNAFNAMMKNLKLEIIKIQKDIKGYKRLINKYDKLIVASNKKLDSFLEKKETQKFKDSIKERKADEKYIKIEEKMKHLDINPVALTKKTIQCLIPINPNHDKKVVIGHNVSYDRARVLEEYDYKDSNTFFLDTLSLHVSISGMCSKQRGRFMQWRKMQNKDKLTEKESLNPLQIEKIEEETFEKQWASDINKEGEEESSFLETDPWLGYTSMNSLKDCAKHYCNIEVDKEIRDVFVVSESFKPIVEDIQNLITYCANDVNTTDKLFQTLYPQFQERLPHPVSFSALKPMGKAFLPMKKAKWENYIQSCESMYQDYMCQIQKKIDSIIEDLLLKYDIDENFWMEDPWLSQLDWERIPYVLKKDGSLAKNNPFAEKPMWYKNLAISSKKGLNLTVRSQMIPLFFKLEYLGKPIVVDRIWMNSEGKISENQSIEIKDVDKDENGDNLELEESTSTAKEMFCLCFDVEDEKEVHDLVHNKNHKMTGKSTSSGLGSRLMIIHPNDADARTTSIISKAFKGYFENGTITSSLPVAQEALKITTMCSYWVSSRKRICNQWVVSKDDILNSHNKNIKDSSSLLNKTADFDNAMIIPSLITMGTVTRRAVENTWLTASNIKANRIGSELKSLVEAPEGYCFVGADVDSEELWIGSLIADSLFENHGSTPLGWMCLEGTKKEGTDLHTTTGKILNCSRDNAKVFNYSRIYGAGKTFTAQLLKKLNPLLSKQDCNETTDELYIKTKGYLTSQPKVYYGGSESALFTKLNNIANEPICRTPVLKARITECLSVNKLNVQNNYLTSRINWIIQSSGVDYLHLLIVSMEYLIKKYNIDARLVISIHDEIRFMCKTEDKYRTSMALQISNLWTRAAFCQALNLDDLPQSCAFFTGVDIDSVLRKEVNIDCVTVSSPDPIPFGKCLDIYDILEQPESDLGKPNENINLMTTDISNEKKIMKGLNYKSRMDIIGLSKLAMVNEQDLNNVKKLKEYYKNLNPEELKNKLSQFVLNEDYETSFGVKNNNSTNKKSNLRFSMNSL